MKLEAKYTVLTVVFLALCVFILTACGSGQPTPTPPPTSGPGAGFMPTEPFGINFSSHWGHDNQDRHDLSVAKQIGADWDRWDFRWNEVEPNADGRFEWISGVGDENIDIVRGVNLDDDAGLKVIGVLNGPIPLNYQTPDGPTYYIEGLEKDVFT